MEAMVAKYSGYCEGVSCDSMLCEVNAVRVRTVRFEQ